MQSSNKESGIILHLLKFTWILKIREKFFNKTKANLPFGDKKVDSLIKDEICQIICVIHKGVVVIKTINI